MFGRGTRGRKLFLGNVRQQIRDKAFNYICKDACWEGLSLSECRKEKCDLYKLAIKVEDVEKMLDGLADQLKEEVDLRTLHKKIIKALGYASTSPNYIDGFKDGYSLARKELVACLRGEAAVSNKK